jgi:hypothetical protein
MLKIFASATKRKRRIKDLVKNKKMLKIKVRISYLQIRMLYKHQGLINQCFLMAKKLKTEKIVKDS